MSYITDFIKNNPEKARKLARENATYNKEGLMTISKDDEWFYDDIWEKDFAEKSIQPQ